METVLKSHITKYQYSIRFTIDKSSGVIQERTYVTLEEAEREYQWRVIQGYYMVELVQLY